MTQLLYISGPMPTCDASVALRWAKVGDCLQARRFVPARYLHDTWHLVGDTIADDLVIEARDAVQTLNADYSTTRLAMILFANARVAKRVTFAHYEQCERKYVTERAFHKFIEAEILELSSDGIGAALVESWEARAS
jgi:hypothetical protein